ncbi:MAG: hypothetical protein ACREX4_20435 [Gammaproteobacteria bacterium]
MIHSHPHGAGHLFARDAAGVMLTWAAGPYDESHDAADQGELQIYHGDPWRIASNNIWSKSGIRQHVADHNCLQFGTANQAMATCSMTHNDDGNLLNAFADLAPAYGQPVTRSVQWDRSARKITITDSFSGQAAWRCNVNELPSVSGDIAMSETMTIRCVGATPVIVDMKSVEPAASGPWRIEFQVTDGCTVEITW